MSETGNFCGTGLSNTIKPGDPDLTNSILSASSGSNCIYLTWTYPLVNPHALSYTTIYRSKQNDPETAFALRKVSGDNHVDEENIEHGVPYFYWIRMTSMSGTEGELIGPASAAAHPPWADFAAKMEGELGASVLNRALREKIDLITDISSALTDEQQARLLGDNYITQIMQDWQKDLDRVDTLIRSADFERVKGDEALALSISTMLAKSDDNAAAIQEEKITRANSDHALAMQVNTLQATVGDTSASLQRVQKVTNNIEQGLSAMYTVRTDVNGLVTGFGLYNDGVRSDFMVNAHRFAIAYPEQSWENGVPKTDFPFYLGKDSNNNEGIFLNVPTFIKDGEIVNAKIGDVIHSTTRIGNDFSWIIKKDGTARFQNIYARGDIEASSIKANTIEAKHIKGGGISKVFQNQSSGHTVNPRQSILGFRWGFHGGIIPDGTTANVIGTVYFQGQGNGATNVGCEVKVVHPNGHSWVLHDNDVTAEDGRTTNGASSFAVGGLTKDSMIEVYIRNTHHSGKLTSGKVGASVMLSLM